MTVPLNAVGRTALQAGTPARTLKLVLAAVGVAVGLVAAAAVTRLMSTLLYGVTPLDPLTYAAVPVVLVIATVLASYLPARQIASVDPVEALRSE